MTKWAGWIFAGVVLFGGTGLFVWFFWTMTFRGW